MISVIAFIVYVTFLGTKEPIYEFMRRTGIYFGFAGGAFAQLFVALAMCGLTCGPLQRPCWRSISSCWDLVS